MANPTRAILFPILWPLGLTVPASRRPWATFVLIGVNFVVLVLQALSPEEFQFHLALNHDPTLHQYLTCSVTHTNLAACLLNMICLGAFAPALESRLGPFKLLLLYLGAGAAGAGAHHSLQTALTEPLAGAAAPLFGFMGASLVLFPRVAVRVFVSLILLIASVFAKVLNVPVLLFALIYAGLELCLVELDTLFDLPFLLERTAFSLAAHVGGLVGGAALAAALGLRVVRPKAAAPGPEVPELDEIQGAATPISPGIPRAPVSEALPSPLPRPASPFDSPSPVPAATPQPLPPRIEELFGNPEDSAVAARVPAMKAAPLPRKSEPVNLKPRLEDDQPIALDLTGVPLQATPPAPPEVAPPLIPSLVAGPCFTDDASSPEHPERPVLREPSDFVHSPVDAPPEAPSAPLELQLEPSDETLEQALALKDQTAWPDLQEGRFSVILAPGRPQNLTPIVDLLAKSMGLSSKGAYHALVHRHGILAENLSSGDAERIASDFARTGHPVLQVALTPRIQFGEGLDLLAIKERQGHVDFTTVTQTIHTTWSQIVLLAAGQVSANPGTPSRTVLDLFLIQPRHHLRLWEHTFVYTTEAPKFRPMVETIAHKACRAIHTHSLDQWLRGEKYTLHRFGGMIEYDHYLRWHLMAHLAPTLLIHND